MTEGEVFGATEENEGKPTYEERKAKALAEGKKITFIVCPLCLKGRPMRTRKRGTAVFRIDPNPEVLQVRYGIGGRACGGFFKSEDECVRLSDLREANLEVYRNLSEEVGKLNGLFQRE